MNKQLDLAQSTEMAQKIKSKAKKTFENAYKAAEAIANANYVQGFLVYPGQPYQPLEHAWVEVKDIIEDETIIKIIDPNFPHLKQNPDMVWYFAAHSLTVKQLKAIIEESEEDYPEDDPLPIYGDAPYEYYGDVMLGGKNYQAAYEQAMEKCQEINSPIINNN